MKKTTVFILITALILSLIACTSTGGNDKEKTGMDEDLNTIIEKIYEKTDFQLNVENTNIDLTNTDNIVYNMGLQDASKIKEAVVSEALIGSQAYSLVLAKVNDATDAKEVAEAMFEGIDQRKWICVEADDLQVIAHGDLVLLVMVDSSMEDTITSQKLVDSFKEIYDITKLDFELSK